MSRSTLYLYPSTIPITAANLLQAFSAVPEPATSFLSVPYILEMLAEGNAGMESLVKFELVSTGGSPLPAATGDRLCRSGVKLVSRYGSSECGCEWPSSYQCKAMYLGLISPHDLLSRFPKGLLVELPSYFATQQRVAYLRRPRRRIV